MPRALLPYIQPPNTPFPDTGCVPPSCHQSPVASCPKWFKQRQQQLVGPQDILMLRACSPHTLHEPLLDTYSQIGSRIAQEPVVATAPLFRDINTRALMRVLKLSCKLDQISVILIVARELYVVML